MGRYVLRVFYENLYKLPRFEIVNEGAAVEIKTKQKLVYKQKNMFLL